MRSGVALTGQRRVRVTLGHCCAARRGLIVSRGRGGFRAVVRVVGVLVACALVAGGCSSSVREPRGGAAESTGEVTVAEGGSVTVGGVTVAVAPGAVDSDGTMRVAVDTAGSVDVGDAATPVVEAVLVDAELVGSATIDLPIVGDGVDPSTVIGGFVDDEGTFRPLESTVGPGGRMLRITTPHFTSFLGVHVDPGAVLSSVADRVGNLLTGRAGADQPRCDGEDDARSDGVEVTSDSGDLVKWCFGRTSAGRALTVTNNRSAAVLVTYPAVWAAGDVTGGGVSFESIGAWLSSQAPLPEGLDARVVGGGSSIVFTLPDGAEAGTVEIEMDLLTWAFSGFDIAVSAGLAVYQRFLSVSGSADEIVSGALTAGEAADAGAFFTCFNEVFGGDLDPRQSVADAGFDATAQALEFAVRCGFDTVNDRVEAGGLNVVARTVVGVVSAALGFVVAGLNAVFAGLRNLYDMFTGSASYSITVDHAENPGGDEPVPPRAGPPQGNLDAPPFWMCVSGVADDDTLNLRSGPGVSNITVHQIPPRWCDIYPTGREAQVGDSTWIEVDFYDHLFHAIGWANSDYLREEPNPCYWEIDGCGL